VVALHTGGESGLELRCRLTEKLRGLLPVTSIYCGAGKHSLVMFCHALFVTFMHDGVLTSLVLIAEMEEESIPVFKPRCHEVVFRSL
jgi:hypothetical protein